MKKYQCIVCGWIYDEAEGWPQDGITAGTKWEDIPDDWTCPDCGVSKADFEKIDCIYDYDGNTIIMHHTTFEEKGNSYPEFESLNKKFIIKYDEVEDFYYIEKIITSDYDESGFI